MMSTGTRVKVAVTAAVVFISACSNAGSVTDRGVWSETATCPDVFFVGARGSGQDPGIGPELSDFYEQFLAKLEPARDIEAAVYPLDYPAADSRFGSTSQYTDSVSQGARALPVAVDMLLSRCQAARIVVAGYSQGAHVITMADHDSLAAANVDAVILLANPVFAPDDATGKAGDFNPDQGGIAGQVSINGALAERTIQLCLAGDPVCQFGSLAFWVHTNGYQGEALDQPAGFAADQINPNL